MVAIQNAVAPPQPVGANTNEVVKYVRNNIIHDNADYDPISVKSRSRGVFRYEREEDTWKRTMQRRLKQMQCGFFAKNGQPYQECGVVELSTKRLVLGSLSSIGNRFDEKGYVANLLSDINSQKYKDIFKQYRASTVPEMQQKLESNNGMSSIKECLTKAEKRIVSVKAGQPLNACINKEKTEQKRRLEAEETDSNSHDIMLLVDPMEQQVGIPRHHNGDDSNEPATCRKKVDFLEKLNCLLLLFNTIQNMRLRDLKTKTPLPIEILNVLRKGPMNEINNIQTSRLSRRSMTASSANPARDVLEPAKRLLYPEVVSRIESVASPINASIVKKRNLHAKYKHSPTCGITANKVETWDELIAFEVNSIRTESTIQEMDTSTRVGSRMSVNGHGKFHNRRKNGAWTSRAEYLPPWQKMTQETRDSSNKEIQNTRSQSNELKSKKHDKILQNLKTSFENTKTQHATKMQEELESRSDLSLSACRKQFELLSLSDFRDKDIKTMRTKVNEWRHQVNMSTARPPCWFDMLKTEQKQVQLLDDDEANEKIKQLAKFMDMKSISYIQAKLCLLIFSLPIYELCTHQMQSAVKFFVCDILELPLEHLKDWLHARKLVSRHDTKEK